MELTYTKVGDYCIPDLILDEAPVTKKFYGHSFSGTNIGAAALQSIWAINFSCGPGRCYRQLNETGRVILLLKNNLEKRCRKW